MIKVLILFALLIGFGLGNLIINPEFTIPQKGLVVGAFFLFAGTLSYFNDLFERWKVDGQ